MEKKKEIKTISYIIILTLLGKLMALGRDMLFSRAYGTGMEANAFFTASRIPRVFFDAIFASAITMSFIPIFTDYLKKDSRDKAFEFSNVFISYAVLFTSILSIIGIVFSDSFASLFAKDFHAQTLALSSSLLKFMFPIVVLAGITFSLIGILQSLENFIIPALISIVFNGVIILYLLGIIGEKNVYGLAIVYLIGWLAQILIQVPSLYKEGFRFKPSLNLDKGYMKRVGIMMLPVMVSTWVQPANLIVNTRFASGLYNDAGVSALEYSNNIYTMIISIFVLSIMNVIFPKMSQLIVAGENKKLEELTGQALGIALSIAIPLMIGLMSLSTEITTLIYSGKNFGAFSVKITSFALFYFSLGMIGFTLQNILARSYFARKMTKIPMFSAIVAILANLVLCYLLVDSMEIGGLALSASLSALINGLLLAIPLMKKGHYVFNKTFMLDLAKISISALSMAGIIYLCKPFIYSTLANNRSVGISNIIKILSITLIGVIVYAGLVLILKPSSLIHIKNIAIEKRKKKA